MLKGYCLHETHEAVYVSWTLIFKALWITQSTEDEASMKKSSRFVFREDLDEMDGSNVRPSPFLDANTRWLL